MKPNTQPLAGLYAITDSGLMTEDCLIPMVEQALKGGAAIVQYRDKSTHQSQRLSQATALTKLCAVYKRPLLINDDIQLAKASGAAGVHLGQGDGSVAEARAALGETAIIGVTCHDSLDLALKAQQQGADYVAFGAFFASQTLPFVAGTFRS